MAHDEDELRLTNVKLSASLYDDASSNIDEEHTTFTCLLAGDVNDDGRVYLTDAIMIVYSSLGMAQTGFSEGAADFNNDGRIDLTDAIGIVYKSLGIGATQAPQRRELEAE